MRHFITKQSFERKQVCRGPHHPAHPVLENRTRLKPAEQMLGEDLTDSLRPGAINLTVMSELRWGGGGGSRLGVMTTARDKHFL